MSGAGRQIRRLFVANRGEIARRVIRSAHEMGIETAVGYADGDALAPFAAEAGAAVALGGRSAAETYLDPARLLEAARRTGCDAVHPGYGFLSESAGFAEAVRKAGLVFVGPPTAAIAALGDKLAARQAAVAAGIPVLGDPPSRAGDAIAWSDLPLPVIIKAVAGGGGKGMRIVRRRDELADAVAAAAREAKAAFGDERVFVEPYLERARHVEVQVLGDEHGNLVHCGERECSIQRRHQKVVEEAPSPAVSPELREELGQAALRIAAAFGYVSTGTVELLLAPDGRFFFLEVNTRLQVEHPVTELVTGLDLVREQLLVAMGAPLSFSQDDLTLRGHAIEARLYAEDVAAGYLPAAGRVELWRPAGEPAVRVDSGIETGSVVGIEFDPLLAKVVAHGPTRREAAGRLALALARTAVVGLTTNREHLIGILRDEAFLSGDTTTAFIEERQVPARIDPGPTGRRLAGLAAALAAEESARAAAPVLASLPSGWRNGVLPPERRTYRIEGSPEGGAGEPATVTVEYRRRRDGSFAVSVAGPEGEEESTVVRRGGGLEVEGVRHRLRVDRVGARTVVGFESGAALELVELPRFPEPARPGTKGALVAPMPGRVLSTHAEVGEEVARGQLLVIVEAMKMEHRITAPVAGTVREVRVTAGSQVASGDLLVAIDPALDHDGRAAPEQRDGRAAPTPPGRAGAR